jgi:hypothetical protein
MRSVILTAALFATSLCYAGSEESFLCKRCELKGTYVRGNLMSGYQIVAYCSNKHHLVNIAWGYNKHGLKPAKFDRNVPLYMCPVCKTPTARKWDERTCPRCGSKNIAIKDTGMFVD